MIFPSC